MGKFKRTFGFIFNHPLGKRHPVKAVLRFIAWQLQSSFASSKLIVKSFVSPVKFYARKGLTGITGNIYTGLHEFDDMAFLLHFLRHGDVFFDVGANVGSYTLLASGVCLAKTIAIEPAADTSALLSNNILLNNLKERVTIIRAAAGSKAGVTTFSKNEDTTNHIIPANNSESSDCETVGVVCIDDLTLANQPALIKIDVEGFETEVLRGMVNTLRQPQLKALIIELNGSGMRYGFNEPDIHAFLISNNFRPYQYDAFKRVLNQMVWYGAFNTIYCRDISFINDRLKTAPGFKIMGERI